MSPLMYLVSIGFIFGTILLVFGMKYFSAAFQARARIAADIAYQTLAEKAVATQAQTQTTLFAIQAELAKVAAGVAAVEKVLKQVE